MDINKAIEILKCHNEWRRTNHEPCDPPHTAKELGEAIDFAIDILSKFNEFDWFAYKAQVSSEMLPIIYPLILSNYNGIRNAEDVASDETIKIAISMSEKLEKRLKGEK